MTRVIHCTVLALLVASVLVSGANESGPGAKPAHKAKLLVPAYFYPGGAGIAHWEKLLQVGKDAEVVVIVNPASGPGKKADPNYVKIFERLGETGILPIGYVSTSYAKRPLAEVQADVDRWLALYPGTRGIFFDEQASAADKVEYYVAAAAHVRKKLPKALIVANPGTSYEPEYFSRPTADVICVLEQGKVPTMEQLQKVDPKVAPRCAVLIYDVAKAEEMQQTTSALLKHKVGYVFVTDGKLPNPWDRLPPWWDEQVKALKQPSGQKPKLQSILKGDASKVSSLAFSPDSKTLAISSSNGTIKVWDVTSGKDITTFRDDPSNKISIAFSPNGKTLATAGDKTIRLWDVNGKNNATFLGHTGLILSVAFSPDGKTLASGSTDRKNPCKPWGVVS